MNNLAMMQSGNQTAVKMKDLEVSFHPSLLASECKEEFPLGVQPGREQAGEGASASALSI